MLTFIGIAVYSIFTLIYLMHIKMKMDARVNVMNELVIDVAHNLLGNVSVIQKVFKEGLVPGAIALMVLILTVFIIFRIIVFVFFEVI